MKEKITPYLRNLLSVPSIELQYLKSAEVDSAYDDPLGEESFEVIRGLVHKYPNRALIKVSYRCAAHCRFCTRARQIGNPAGDLGVADIQAIGEYLEQHPEIEDVILSGGDPLYTPTPTRELLGILSNISSVRILRIGTRLPFQLPASFNRPVLQLLLKELALIAQRKPVFILVHVNHPDEITPEARTALRILKCTGVTLLSQSVFLKNINDDAVILATLFRELYFEGVIPYYIYHCDAVAGMERFTVPLETEIRVMRELHSRLSGIAVPRHVIDISGGNGKIPVSSGFWNPDSVSDFEGNTFPIPG